MDNTSTRKPVTIAAVVGIALWCLAAVLAGGREPWDGPAYWALAYPLAVVTCALLGYSFPERPWRWPLALFAAQFVAMCLLSGELGSLWPLGMVMFAVLALPGIAAARVAARFSAASGGGRA